MDEYRKVTIRNITSGDYVILDEDGKDYLLDQDGLDLGVVTTNLNTTEYIDLVGSHLDSIQLKPRDVSITGWIIGKDLEEIKTRKRVLDSLINVQENIAIEYNGYALDVSLDASIQYSTKWLEDNDCMVKFLIQGTALFPLFRLVDAYLFASSSKKISLFHFPWSIPADEGTKFGFYEIGSTRYLANTGDLNTGFTATITADKEDIDSPKLINTVTGDFIQINRILELGESLVINTEAGQQSAFIERPNGRINALNFVTLASNLNMKLKRGMNSMVVLNANGQEPELYFLVKYAPRFLEVAGR